MARKKSESKNKAKKYFFLSGKKLLFIILAWVVSVVLHNAFYALFGIEEAVFFLIAVIVIPLYLIISVVYTLFKFIKK